MQVELYDKISLKLRECLPIKPRLHAKSMDEYIGHAQSLRAVLGIAHRQLFVTTLLVRDIDPHQHYSTKLPSLDG